MDPITGAFSVLTTGIGAFQNMVPGKLDEMRKLDPNLQTERAADLRMGEVAAVGVTLGVGAIASSFTKSTMPIIIAVIVCIGFVFLYETTIQSDRPLESSNAIA